MLRTLTFYFRCKHWSSLNQGELWTFEICEFYFFKRLRNTFKICIIYLLRAKNMQKYLLHMLYVSTISSQGFATKGNNSFMSIIKFISLGALDHHFVIYYLRPPVMCWEIPCNCLYVGKLKEYLRDAYMWAFFITQKP